MREKSYTNPADRGRFGFSESGKFRAPYKLETFAIAATIAAAIVALVLTVIMSVKIMRSNFTGVETGRMMEALIIGVVMVFVIFLIVLAAWFVIKFVSEGFSCSYIADEEKFTVEIGGTHRTIYYRDVQNVHFLPRMLRGAVRGYNVTVKVNGVSEEFGIVSSGYISEKTTPFYIIKERVELIRLEEERKRADNGEFAAKSAGGREEKEKPKSINEFMSQIDVKIPEMPVKPIPPVSGPESDGQVPPAVNLPADNVPDAVKPLPTYLAEDGRDRYVNDIVAQGTFREAMKPGKAVIIGVIAIMVYVAAFLSVYLLITGKLNQPTVSSVALFAGMGIMIIIAPFYAGTVINFLRNGDEYRYAANGREFVIYAKGKPDEHILYSDVQSVEYVPMEFLWFIKGYKVEILTRYGVLKYNYVFPGLGGKQSTKNLPFEEIRKRINTGRDM